ncbi:ABC transporter ATP-binding protein [Aeromicrobium wangtongii]|uniref:ABC transporter ATP-binding protein n=1 Tax=Aeromicrobium wangtongii TaxID=2969247 RepID=UPI0020175C0A|nr:ATP-binding cassette domain-containing protein [Aeromicrobium wangtongii]MCL3818678.1 ATP-binding cassette domain-containing protein [Aeromicrobium wangtongii]
MLRLDAVSHRYPGSDVDALEELSLEVPGGTAMGLFAPSGSGKTTLMRIASLSLRPTAGAVTVAGHPVSAVRYAVPRSIRRTMGTVGQSPRAATSPRLSLRRIIAEPLSFADGRRTPHASAYTERISELADLVQLSPDLLDRLPHQVSDGQLQRACLARALALDPKVLLCDEPTAMLDASTTAVIMRVIAGRAEQGAAVLVASHDHAVLGASCHVLRPLGGTE